MKIITSSAVMARQTAPPAARVCFVPTMGALHDGHATLIRLARKQAGPNGRVIVSIFVNPTQFAPGEDFHRYPRPWEKDRALCEKLTVDLLFRPRPSDFYAADHSVFLSENQLSTRLCGASRPSHFTGVLTVVAKLFHLVRPTHAIFGRKDHQQLALVQRMVRDLAFPVKIIAAPTVREPDGLALSSRNRYLSPIERATAPAIYHTLRTARDRTTPGSPAAPLRRWIARRLAALPGAHLDYAEIVHPATLTPLTTLQPPAIALVALHLGSTRLIDNLPLLP